MSEVATQRQDRVRLGSTVREPTREEQAADVTDLLPLFSVLLGGFVTYWFNVRVRRRTNEEDAYQAAIAAVAVAEASRNFLRYQSRPARFSDEEYRDLVEERDQKDNDAHIAKVAEAQLAIARLVPYEPSVRYYDKPSDISERPEEIIGKLSGRLDAIRRRRRFRAPLSAKREIKSVSHVAAVTDGALSQAWMIGCRSGWCRTGYGTSWSH